MQFISLCPAQPQSERETSHVGRKPSFFLFVTSWYPHHGTSLAWQDTARWFFLGGGGGRQTSGQQHHYYLFINYIRSFPPGSKAYTEYGACGCGLCKLITHGERCLSYFFFVLSFFCPDFSPQTPTLKTLGMWAYYGVFVEYYLYTHGDPHASANHSTVGVSWLLAVLVAFLFRSDGYILCFVLWVGRVVIIRILFVLYRCLSCFGRSDESQRPRCG